MVTTMPTNMADVAKRPGAARQTAADRDARPAVTLTPAEVRAVERALGLMAEFFSAWLDCKVAAIEKEQRELQRQVVEALGIVLADIVLALRVGGGGSNLSRFRSGTEWRGDDMSHPLRPPPSYVRTLCEGPL